MLRNAILGVCLVLLLCATVGALADWTAWPAVVMLAALTAAIAFERIRYHDKVKAEPRAPLAPTAERFIDPESGAFVQVWANASGERHYVEEVRENSLP
ncbi:MAG: hypothetical protein JWP15_472 [Alphaproteobacteria bacterium]|nr:hypothetical protein [Alphaproteobacteria bacterium]